MNAALRLPLALLLLPVIVFFVTFMWTIDKFIQPEHGAKILAEIPAPIQYPNLRFFAA